MKTKLFLVAIMAIGLAVPKSNAQVSKDTTKTKWEQRQEQRNREYYERNKKYKLESLQDEKQEITESEKFNLKKQIETIDDQFENGEITAEKSKALKEEAAKNAALNIDNKTAIIDNQIALIQRDVNYQFDLNTGSYIALGVGNAYDRNGSALFGIEYKAGKKKQKYDKRTYSDVVISSGFGNAVGNGQNLGKPFKVWGSRFIELGYTFKTRLKKDSNFLRLSYGISYQFGMYKLTDNRYFVNDGGTTIFEKYPNTLTSKTNLRTENLIIPFYLEFGPSEKKEYKDHFRYDTSSSFKVGIGGFAGINTGTVQKLQYKQNGDKITDKYRADYNVNPFIYGLNAYVGIGSLSLFVKYQLNPLFEHSEIKGRPISFGVRFDL
ncbi:hypothetical protein [Flavobacterium rhizosphaerae]|uniref:Outer membrane protein beta-barrel domain-containing protein n=1 Tax=Flavobacterium rhizosphaerae TaxID=3163298 RepID=A0ABW8Z1Y3_9FLAO